MINHHFSSGVYAKETKIPAGNWLVQHAHLHDHLSILASGSVKLKVDDRESIIHAPACLTIEAGKHHGVMAITDTVWYCIHATSCTDENEVDNVIVAPANMEKVRELAQAFEGN